MSHAAFSLRRAKGLKKRSGVQMVFFRIHPSSAPAQTTGSPWIAYSSASASTKTSSTPSPPRFRHGSSVTS